MARVKAMRLLQLLKLLLQTWLRGRPHKPRPWELLSKTSSPPLRSGKPPLLSYPYLLPLDPLLSSTPLPTPPLLPVSPPLPAFSMHRAYDSTRCVDAFHTELRSLPVKANATICMVLVCSLWQCWPSQLTHTSSCQGKGSLWHSRHSFLKRLHDRVVGHVEGPSLPAIRRDRSTSAGCRSTELCDSPHYMIVHKGPCTKASSS